MNNSPRVSSATLRISCSALPRNCSQAANSISSFCPCTLTCHTQRHEARVFFQVKGNVVQKFLLARARAHTGWSHQGGPFNRKVHRDIFISLFNQPTPPRPLPSLLPQSYYSSVRNRLASLLHHDKKEKKRTGRMRTPFRETEERKSRHRPMTAITSQRKCHISSHFFATCRQAISRNSERKKK